MGQAGVGLGSSLQNPVSSSFPLALTLCSHPLLYSCPLANGEDSPIMAGWVAILGPQSTHEDHILLVWLPLFHSKTFRAVLLLFPP